MIGNFLVKRRKDLGISRKDFAEQVGLSYSSVTLIETNRRIIPKKYIEKVANVLNINIKELQAYNTLGQTNNLIQEKNLLTKQLKKLSKNITELETSTILAKKERKLLCNRLFEIEKEQNQLKTRDKQKAKMNKKVVEQKQSINSDLLKDKKELEKILKNENNTFELVATLRQYCDNIDIQDTEMLLTVNKATFKVDTDTKKVKSVIAFDNNERKIKEFSF